MRDRLPDAQLATAIAQASDRDALIAAATNALPGVQDQLHALGFDAVACARRITQLVDTLTQRLIGLTELGPPPAAYAWLAAGSQGRGEQTAYTDQDTALIHAPTASEQAARYFTTLARAVGQDLDTCGIPTCSGGVAADQPDWSGDCATWERRLLESVTITDTHAVMRTAQYFDLRVVHGEAQLFEPLRRRAMTLAAGQQRYLQGNAANLRRGPRSIGVLGSWPRVRSGPHRGLVSLKQSGLIPISQLAQRHALRARLDERHTLERLRAAAAAGVIDRTSADELIIAYRLIAQMRLEHLVERRRGRQPLSNHLDPAALPALQRKVLRAALASVHAQRAALRLGDGD